MLSKKTISELFLLASGFTLLLSLPVIAATGSFLVWVTAKILYFLGVSLFLFNK